MILSESNVTLRLNAADSALLQKCKEYDEADKQYPDVGQFETILCKTVKFHDKIEGDVKICNGDTGPWMELVIFDNGSELTCSDVGDVSFGKLVSVHDGEEFSVDVQPAS